MQYLGKIPTLDKLWEPCYTGVNDHHTLYKKE